MVRVSNLQKSQHVAEFMIGGNGLLAMLSSQFRETELDTARSEHNIVATFWIRQSRLPI
jgi:hypothetical protein